MEECSLAVGRRRRDNMAAALFGIAGCEARRFYPPVYAFCPCPRNVQPRIPPYFPSSPHYKLDLQRFDCRFPVLLPVVDKPLLETYCQSWVMLLRNLSLHTKSRPDNVPDMKVKAFILTACRLCSEQHSTAVKQETTF